MVFFCATVGLVHIWFACRVGDLGMFAGSGVLDRLKVREWSFLSGK